MEHYQKRNYQRIEIRSIPVFFCKEPQEKFLNVLMNAGAIISDTFIHHCTRLPYKIINHGKRWGKKKALKNKLYVKEMADFAFFWERILKPNLRNKHAVSPTHSLAEIQRLKSRFPNQIRLYGVYQSGLMLGGAVVYETDLCNHLQYIAATEYGKKLACLDLLMSTLIEDRSSQKAYFNMGVSHIPPTGKPNKGLLQWKESLGGKPFPAHRLLFNLTE
ncbi:hypothetical protein [Lunatimonas salinarum]|uniref:hypothetical protein n=1 Tax=Lunatimonas salinarum TaxID=1774590 RepID=UPI001ADFB968|nr:hypothetical protein [Lunatimonas salinarum]